MKKRTFWKPLTLTLGLSALLTVGAWAAGEGQVTVSEIYEVPSVWEGNPAQLQLMSGPVYQTPLAEGHHASWIDRLSLYQPQSTDTTPVDTMRVFYDTMLEATDADGISDAMIEDSYFQFSNGVHKTWNTAAPGETFETDVTVQYEDGTTETRHLIGMAAYRAALRRETFEAERGKLMTDMENVYAAFIRDDPGVFWLKQYQCGWISSTSGETAEVVFYLVLKDDKGFDIRGEYAGQLAGDQGLIQARDAAASAILEEKSITEKTDRLEAIRHFNDWLTKHNEYNTLYPGEPASAHNCLSALEGKTDDKGPVCEGYATAFKVLCDRVGIPCVIVTGAGHMWNNVELDGKWYAVDVTWNDPEIKNEQNQHMITENPSKAETEAWLLIGEDTLVKGQAFKDSHPVDNSYFDGGLGFPNGPELNSTMLERVGFRELDWSEPVQDSQGGWTKTGSVTYTYPFTSVLDQQQYKTSTTISDTVPVSHSHSWSWQPTGGVYHRVCAGCGTDTTVSLALTAPDSITSGQLTVTADVTGAYPDAPLRGVLVCYESSGKLISLQLVEVSGNTLTAQVDNTAGKIGQIKLLLVDQEQSTIPWVPLCGSAELHPSA